MLRFLFRGSINKTISIKPFQKEATMLTVEAHHPLVGQEQGIAQKKLYESIFYTIVSEKSLDIKKEGANSVPNISITRNLNEEVISISITGFSAKPELDKKFRQEFVKKITRRVSALFLKTKVNCCSRENGLEAVCFSMCTMS
jgi:hypothetical protein